ncbi:hypothetical protein A3L04_03295 [Thermococcus chitonophagus]|uniref:Uncharacterized protein n=2 Tax=Thermococcus chitonophagus TaxID=54262 RepID=A0A170SYU4_9EURY|nr:hypothetical protein A3L04_03295 [Thermococcus chitonophagus]CUX78859.1 hypothetical protein CHITON_2080 [Thermococcus chitonophagus]
MVVGKRFVSALFVVFSAGTATGLAKYYSPVVAVALATATVALALLLPWLIVSAISKKKHRYSVPLAFLSASLWEFACSYLAKLLDYPLWNMFLFAGLGGLITVVFTMVDALTKPRRHSAEVK